ncbi:MAG: DUF1269 domain-containing protein [Anaerolineae bacterium]|nr:DUF1269 domain-containing protein [Anaerolineae bacterium]
MSKESKEQNQSLFVVVFDFKESAESVYSNLKSMEDAGHVKVKTASTIYRNKHGKLKVHHKHGLTKWAGAGGGVAIGFLLGGPILGGAIGLLAGSRGGGEQRKAKKFLDDKLNDNNSAIIALFEEADWAAVENLFARFDAEIMQMELSAEAEKEWADLANDSTVASAVHDEVEVNVDDDEGTANPADEAQ